MDARRIGLLFLLALLIGLALVQLRTNHMQQVRRITSLVEQERLLRQSLWDQQLRLAQALEAPRRVREQAARLRLGVCPWGTEPGRRLWLARAEDPDPASRTIAR